MAQNVIIAGALYQNVPAIDVPKSGGGTARFVDETTVSAGGGEAGMNVQGYHGMKSVRTTSYSATNVEITVKKTGVYNISWMAFRNNTSGTWGTQLYINGKAYGTASTSFTQNYGQSVVLNNVSLKEGDVIEVYARTRSTSYYMYVGNLIAEQTS